MKENRFICDFMLGSLAKWMRLLGIDTEYYNHPGEPGIIHIAKKQERIILTRSRKLTKNEKCHLIHSEKLDEQLEEIKELIDISNPFSRCPICNVVIIPIEKEKIKDRVPDYIYEIHNHFKICPECDRIYWRGTHYKAIKRKIDEIFS